MGTFRGHRFLIDAIDERLGSVEKEIKFDKITIAVGFIMLVAGVLMVYFSEARPNAALCIVGIMLSLVGASVMYAMTKELIADSRRAKNSK